MECKGLFQCTTPKVLNPVSQHKVYSQYSTKAAIASIKYEDSGVVFLFPRKTQTFLVMSDTRPDPNEWVQSYHGRTMGRQVLPTPLQQSMFFGGVPEAAAESIATTTTTNTTSTISGSSNSHLNVEGRIGKSTKKRSRASRKGPTTLFNTDTTNFRAMVQQFTGAPTSPFLSPGSQSGAPLINFGLGAHGPYHQSMMRPPSQLPQPSLQQQLQQQQVLGLHGGGESLFSLGSNRATATNVGTSDAFFEGVSSSYGQTSNENSNGLRFVRDERFRTFY